MSDMNDHRLDSMTISPDTSIPPPGANAFGKAKFEDFARRLDLAPIKFKLIKDKAWTVERAERVERQYKAFLFLTGNNAGEMFVPTPDVDEMWHTHILDTRKYMADCALHFGVYVHHYPYLGMKDAADGARAGELFAATRELIAGSLSIDLAKVELSHCGGSSCGGHSCGGHSCGGHSNCTSHTNCSSHDSGHGDHGGLGHHHPTNRDSDSSDIGADCGAGKSPDGQPEDKTPPPAGNKKDKRGILQRIFNLAPSEVSAAWYASVTPAWFNQDEFRPGEQDVKSLAAKTMRTQ